MEKLIHKIGRSPFLLLGLAALINAVLWALVVITFPQDSPAAILHYSAGIGIDFIGEGRQIMALPAAGASILIMNIVLVAVLWPASRRAVWMLAAGTPLSEVILLVAYVLIWRLNL